MLKLIKYPDKSLTIPCKEEVFFSDALRKQVNEMKKAVIEFKGYALAANQVGFTNRVFVVAKHNDLNVGIQVDNEEITYRYPKVIINPEIINPKGEVRFKESCLSLPEIHAWNKRYKSFLLKFKDENGMDHETLAEGLFAIVCQHEIDHLDGKLFVDMIDFVEKSKIQNKLNKMRK